MKYLFLIISFFMIMNSVAMDVNIDWTNEYKKHAQIWYRSFPQKEQEMLQDLSEIVVEKKSRTI
jgi:hypothetical protein